jgi:hypothetical protein
MNCEQILGKKLKLDNFYGVFCTMKFNIKSVSLKRCKNRPNFVIFP